MDKERRGIVVLLIAAAALVGLVSGASAKYVYETQFVTAAALGTPASFGLQATSAPAFARRAYAALREAPLGVATLQDGASVRGALPDDVEHVVFCSWEAQADVLQALGLAWDEPGASAADDAVVPIQADDPEAAVAVDAEDDAVVAMEAQTHTAWDAYLDEGREGLARLYVDEGTHTAYLVGPSGLRAARNSSGMLQGLPRLTSVDLAGLDTAQAEDLSFFFAGDVSLEEVDLLSMDTSSATTLKGMFSQYDYEDEAYLSNEPEGVGPVRLDLSGFDVAKVEDLSDLLRGCNRLKEINVADWDTSAATKLSRAFAGCASLTRLDLSGWDAAQVEAAEDLFWGCTSLVQVVSDDQLILEAFERRVVAEAMPAGAADETEVAAPEADAEESGLGPEPEDGFAAVPADDGEPELEL